MSGTSISVAWLSTRVVGRSAAGSAPRVASFWTIRTVALRQVRRVAGRRVSTVVAAASSISPTSPLTPSRPHKLDGVTTAPPTGPQTDGTPNVVTGLGSQKLEYVAW